MEAKFGRCEEKSKEEGFETMYSTALSLHSRLHGGLVSLCEEYLEILEREGERECVGALSLS